MIEVNAGDIGLTASNSRLAALIRFFSRIRGEEKTVVNHAFLVIKSGSLHTAEVAEAQFKLRRHALWSEYGKKNIKVAIFRPLFIQQEQLDDIVKVMEGMVGNYYGPLKLTLHVADWLVSRALFWRKKDVYLFRRAARLKNFPICSGALGYSYHKGAGVRLGVSWWAVQPDDIWDYCKRNNGIWYSVLELMTLKEAQELGL